MIRFSVQAFGRTVSAIVVLVTIAPAVITSSRTLPPVQDSAPAAGKPAPSLVAVLRENRHDLTFSGGTLEGPGAAFLESEGRAAQFTLIGEDHGIADIPEFTAALFKRLVPAGYHYMVVETGPLSGSRIESMASSKDADAAFAAFNHKYPFALPFFSWREEVAMITGTRAAAGRVPIHVWAVDQEFVLSSAVHFERLVEIAPSPAARTVATELLDRTRTELARIVESKNPTIAFLVSATAADFDRLDSSFRARPGSEAARILRELRLSWEIYAKNVAGQYVASNLQRSRLMKEHFMDCYLGAQLREKAPPRAVFKLGAFHTKRGRSFGNVFDIGNLASEIADSNGSRSFHILVVAADGYQNGYLPFSESLKDKQKPIDAVGSFDFMDLKPVLEAAAPSGWSVIDLRPLRSLIAGRKLTGVERGLEDAIWGYDAVVVFHGARAATLFE